MAEIINKIPTCVALVDCNNFFASCERAMQPQFENVPVAILSSNDGCIIARSEEVKDLGIPMGMPLFKARDLIKEHNIKMFSLNYSLYTETSARIMILLKDAVPNAQIYSIDEAFLDLSGMEKFFDLDKFLQDLRKKIKDEIGIPVSIGVAPTKALAKLANRIAKKKKTTYVEFLMSKDEQHAALKKTRVGDLWGIGRKNATKLITMGITDGLEFITMNPGVIKKMGGGVVEMRLFRELQGKSSLMVEDMNETRHHILSSRSFGTKITTLEEMKDAFTFLLSFAIRKLHQQGSGTTYISVSFRTARHDKDEHPMVCSKTVNLPVATDYPPELLRQTLIAVEEAFVTGCRYAKGAITFTGLEPIDRVQGNLFGTAMTEKQRKVTDLVKKLNKDKKGEKMVEWAAFKLDEDAKWRPLSKLKSDYTRILSDEEINKAKPWW